MPSHTALLRKWAVMSRTEKLVMTCLFAIDDGIEEGLMFGPKLTARKTQCWRPFAKVFEAEMTDEERTTTVAALQYKFPTHLMLTPKGYLRNKDAG